MSELASKYLARYKTISTPRFKIVVECSTLMSLIPSGFSLFIDCKLALCTTFRLQHIRAFFSGGPPLESLLLVLATGLWQRESLASLVELRSAWVSFESLLVLDLSLYLIFADFFLGFSTFRRDFSMLSITLSLPRPAQPAWKKIQTKIAVQGDTKKI